MRPLVLIATATALYITLGCRRTVSVDYQAADPVADARRALMDSGHFHILAVKVGDSLIAPRDTSVLQQRSYNVEVAPEGGIVFLRVDPGRNRQGRPSEAQLRYITRYNTELFALLDTNA